MDPTSPVPQAAQYDAIATAYSTENEHSLFNAFYERPEVLRMAGDVTGLRVLDAGCGSGALSEALISRGANLSGFDISPAMVRLARERCGRDADVAVADLAAPLPYADGAFDLAVASLVLHYVEDWGPTLAELVRVLKPGGRLIVSILHPMIFALQRQDASYFALTQYTEDYTFDGVNAELSYWHRPLGAVFAAFTRAGFRVLQMTEPQAAENTPAELLPESGSRSFVCFLFFELLSA